MFNKKITCITCEKKIEKDKAQKKHQNYFCSDECLNKYEKLLEKAKKEVNLDNCC